MVSGMSSYSRDLRISFYRYVFVCTSSLITSSRYVVICMDPDLRIVLFFILPYGIMMTKKGREINHRTRIAIDLALDSFARYAIFIRSAVLYGFECLCIRVLGVFVYLTMTTNKCNGEVIKLLNACIASVLLSYDDQTVGK